MSDRLTFFDLADPGRIRVLLVAAATALGLFVRLAPALASDFPLNDGGMFLTMVQDLQRNHLALPEYITYNSASIPFAYPPLAFYLAALLAGWGVPLIDIFRVGPALVTTLSIPLFFVLSRRILVSEGGSVFATFAFALLPRTFEWLIMGGGLTRSVGFVFALFALIQIHTLYVRGTRTSLGLTILSAGLTVVSHPEMTLFTAYSTLLMFLFFGRNRAGLIHSALAAVGIVLVTLPWWLSVINYHGLSPLLAASQTGAGGWYGNTLQLLVFDFTEEPFLTLLGGLGLLGVTVLTAEKRYLPLVWMIAIFFLEPRSGATYATIPLAMCTEVALCRVVLPALDRIARRRLGAVNTDSATLVDLVGSTAAKNVLAVVLFYALFSAWYVPYAPNSALRVLPAAQRQAMEWIADSTPDDATFVVVTGDAFWRDMVSEWFPVLTRRTSVGTVQGYEWLPNHQFEGRVERYNVLQKCAAQGTDCLAKWFGTSDHTRHYVYVPKLQAFAARDCCSALRYSLSSSADYQRIYDGQGAIIYAPRNAVVIWNSDNSTE